MGLMLNGCKPKPEPEPEPEPEPKPEPEPERGRGCGCGCECECGPERGQSPIRSGVDHQFVAAQQIGDDQLVGGKTSGQVYATELNDLVGGGGHVTGRITAAAAD